MKTQHKKINSNQIELTIELDGGELKGFISKTEDMLGRDLEVDGFRKGKVPKELIKNHIDPKIILDTAMETAVRDSLANTIKEEDWDVLNVSGLNVKENTSEKLVYTVSLTLFPSIKISDLDFKIKRKDVVVDQNEIDKTLDNIRTSRATFIPKEGKAENGDRVEVDFEVKLDGKVIEGGVSKNHPLILGKQLFIPGFEDNLVGMAVKDKKDFSLIVPKDYPNKVIADKKLEIHVELQDLKKVQLPELNAEFVKSLGNFEDIAQLSANIKEGLTIEKNEKEKQRVRLEILNNIVNKSDITAPENMVQEQLEKMISDFDNDLHRNGMELGPYLVHLNKTVEDLKNDWKKDAEKQVKIMLVVHKISRDQSISATPEELEPAMNEAVQGAMIRGELQKGNIDIEKLKDAIATQIINEKTLQFLEQKCGE